MRQWPGEIAALAKAARDAAANHTKSADFYRELTKVSTWGGQGGQAAHAGMESTARDHEGIAETLTNAAASMDRTGSEAQGIVDKIGGIFKDADAYPAVHIDEDTNQVSPPDISHMDSDTKAKVSAKVTDLQRRLAAVEASGESVDADLGKAIGAATGVPAQPATMPAGGFAGVPGVKDTTGGKPGMSDALKDTLFPGAGQQPPANTKPADAPLSGSVLETLDRVNHPDPKPGDPQTKPTVDPRLAGSLQGTLGQMDQNRPANPRATQAPMLNPDTSEGKAAIDKMRTNLQAIYPPAEAEQRLQAAIKGAETPRPMVAPGPEPKPAPGLVDGFVNKAKAFGEHLEDMAGVNGSDKALDAWKGTAEGLGKQVFEMSNPGMMMTEDAKQGVDEFIDDVRHPDQIANKTGQHLFDLGALAATAPLGGEGAALTRLGDEGALADATRLGTEGARAGLPGLADLPAVGGLSDLAHDLHGASPASTPHPGPSSFDAPAPAMVEHPDAPQVPANLGGHADPTGANVSSGDWGHPGDSDYHGGSPGGHGTPGENPVPFDFNNPLSAARPEFNIPNPLEVMSPELRGLAEQHLTGSGETVLGPFTPRDGGPSYIDVAQQRGASYFDIGDAWNSSTPTQQLAANQHVLDMAITNRDTIKLSVPLGKIDPSSFTGAELRYLEAHGYRLADSSTMIPPGEEISR